MWIKHPGSVKVMNTAHIVEIWCDAGETKDGPLYMIHFRDVNESTKSWFFKSEEARDKEYNKLSATLFSQGGK